MKLSFNVNRTRFDMIVQRWAEVMPFYGADTFAPKTLIVDEERQRAEVTTNGGDLLVYNVVDFANWGC